MIGSAPVEETESAVETAPLADLEAILPPPRWIMVPGDDDRQIRCRMLPLRTREFFGLVRVITTAYGENLANLFALDWSSPEAAGGAIIAVVTVAIPMATDQFLEWLRSILEPTDPTEEMALNEALDNPLVENLFGLVQALMVAEWVNLSDVLGKVAGHLAVMQKVMVKTPTPNLTQLIG